MIWISRRIFKRPHVLQPKQVPPVGFSLIEVLLATVVLIFGLLGLLNLVENSARNTRAASHRAIAVQLAKMKAAEIQAASANGDWLNVAFAQQNTVQIPQSGSPRIFEENPDFQWLATIEKNNNGFADFVVEVSWGQKPASDEENPQDTSAKMRSVKLHGVAGKGVSAQ